MLKRIKAKWIEWRTKIRLFLVTKFSKGLIYLLLKTCRIQIHGLEQFCSVVEQNKCMVMLWHNRLALIPFILGNYTPQFLYAALVSNSKDGNLLSAVVHSYKNGRTIRVSHQARYQALLDIIRHVNAREQIVIMTPDGPRGPLYELKPGIAIAALETQASIVPLNWEADHYWELKTWDRLRIPKPFTTIQVYFNTPVCLDQTPPLSLSEAQALLKQALPLS